MHAHGSNECNKIDFIGSLWFLRLGNEIFNRWITYRDDYLYLSVVE